MTASEIASSPLAGAYIYKYLGAEKIADNQLDIYVEDTTGIESVQPSEITVQKIIIDGNVYIVRDGKMYSILGQMIQ